MTFNNGIQKKDEAKKGEKKKRRITYENGFHIDLDRSFHMAFVGGEMRKRWPKQNNNP